MGETLVDFHTIDWHQALRARAIPAIVDMLSASGYVLSKNPIAEIYDLITRRERNGGRLTCVAKIHQLLDSLGVKEGVAECDELTAKALRLIHAPWIPLMYPYSDVRTGLEYLRNEGYRLGLLSNTPWETPGWLFVEDLERFQLMEFFPNPVFSGDYGLRKPDPRIFNIALDLNQATADDTIFVGDSNVDVAGATAAGMRAVHMNRHNTPLPPECPLPAAIVTDLRELCAVIPEL